MKTKIIIELSIERDALSFKGWLQNMPAATPPTKTAGQKDDDPAWIAALVDFERRKMMHAKAVCASASQLAFATDYCKLVGMSIGTGETAPLTYATVLEDPTPETVEKRTAEMQKWMDETTAAAVGIYQKMDPFVKNIVNFMA